MDGALIASVISCLMPILFTILRHKDNKKRKALEIKNLELENENLRLNNLDLSKEKKAHEIKENVFERLAEVESLGNIESSVERMFDKTKVDRFLILYAKNGKDDFKTVTVMWAKTKDKTKVNPLVYRNLNIQNDPQYGFMLKEARRLGEVVIETDEMIPCLLKDIYKKEGVKFSRVRMLAEKKVDDENTVLIYCSIATHQDTDLTKDELINVKIEYDSVILPSINEIL